ncbi:hypothetical protein GCM10025760_01600 [Microbacterium yannicii]|uniref:allantoinase n=1 Tax=Microbacterium yannicii TaxID=671622 RepID=A0ABP9LRQ3_9MICO
MTRGRSVIRAQRTWLEGSFRPAAVIVERGVIAGIVDVRAHVAGARTVLVPDDAVLLPGLVDSHVHVNEPGRTEWEGFRSATLAAAAGGVTTIVDMPLNSLPPTTTADALEVKRAAAVPSAFIDIGFWGGAVPENLGALAPLHDAGVFGFKCFLSPSGVDEFGHLDRAQLLAAMTEIAAMGSRLIVHAEDPALLHEHGALGREYGAFLASRPARSEASAIDAVIDAARRTGARAHILHLSDAHSLPAIRAAKAEGVALTVETCPHYLTIAAEEIPEGASEFKCCPPIREAANRDLLWEGVVDGTIDAIVSDHSPSTVDLKRSGGGDFGLAWGGISGLQVGLAAVWTEARGRGIPLETILPLYTTGPARVAGLDGVGTIEVGAPAHLTVFGVDDPFAIDAARLLHKNPITAYDRRVLTGRIRRTWLHGESVFDVTAGGPGEAPRFRGAPRGRLLRPAAHGSAAGLPPDAPGTKELTPTPTAPTVLQRGAGPIPGDHYLPASPDTVMWGRLPCETDAAVLTIAPGDTVTFDTVSHEGILEDQGKDPLAFFTGHGVAPASVLDDAIEIAATLSRDPAADGPHVVTGPVFVAGAQPGDLLKITVERLVPRVPYGVISNRHGKGALVGELPRGAANVSVFTPVEERVSGPVGVLPVTEGGQRVVEFPLAPFLGTMGVAVARAERPHSVPPGAHGGNIDINLLTEGAVLYLPVQVPGALAYVGDPHFAQGDGEVALTALEASLRATLRFEVVPRAAALAEFGEVTGPLARAGGYLVPTGLDRDLNVAMRNCVRAALSLLQARYGMDEHLAYAYLSAATDFDISQVVDIVCGVHARIREADFAGVHRG